MVTEILVLFALVPFFSMIRFGVKNSSFKILPFCCILAFTYLISFLILAFLPINNYSLLCMLVTCFSAHVLYGFFIVKKVAGVELEMHDFLVYSVLLGVGLYASIQSLVNSPVSLFIVIGLLSCFTAIMFIQISRYGQKITGENPKIKKFWRIFLVEIGLLAFILLSRIISDFSVYWEFFSVISILQLVYGILLWK